MKNSTFTAKTNRDFFIDYEIVKKPVKSGNLFHLVFLYKCHLALRKLVNILYPFPLCPITIYLSFL